VTTRPGNLTGGHRLARNVIWNLLGNGSPLLVAIVAIPLLIEGLGTARFGVLTIAWMVVGYFGLFDLGLGRALTKLVAEKLGAGQDTEVPPLVWTAMSLMTGFGVLGAVVVALLSPWLVGSALKIPPELQTETLRAFSLLAASIPLVIVTTGLRGILEAYQKFGLINAIRVPLGLLTFLGPLAVLPFSHSLVPVVGALVVARLLSGIAFVVALARVVPVLRRPVGLHRELIGPLASFGGWMTVSNLVGPLMVYLDRFLIGAMVSMTSVAYYTTPYEMITKLRIIPTAMMRVLFPAFATAFAQDQAHAARLFGRAVRYIFLIFFPVILIAVTFAREGLTVWLGPEFAENSTHVLQLLAVGVFINSHASVPFGLVQGAGRPDITAKLHLIELPLYGLGLWWLVGATGITGAAVAWVARVVVDTGALFVVAKRILPATGRRSPWPAGLGVAALALFGLGALLPGLILKALLMLLVLPAHGLVAWFFVLADDEKKMLRDRILQRPGAVEGGGNT